MLFRSVRRPRGDDEAEPVVVIDENTLAAGREYFDLGTVTIAPDHERCAYTTDTDGGERYTLRFRTIAAGNDLADVVEDVTDGVAWADDSRSCFYIRPDAAMRPAEVWCHVLGTDASADRIVLREDDEHFFVSVQRTRSGRFVLIEISSKMTSEVWFIPTDDPAAGPIELEADFRTYALHPVRIPEFGFINVYGTDITAEKVVATAADDTVFKTRAPCAAMPTSRLAASKPCAAATSRIAPATSSAFPCAKAAIVGPPPEIGRAHV